MKIFFIFLFLSSSSFGIESLHHMHFIPPQCVKSSKFFYKASIDSQVSVKHSNPPYIHTKFWPYFCPKHLSEDPAGCSSWSEDKNENIQLDFILTGTAEAYYESELIQSISSQINLIPKNYTRLCDYARCSACMQTVVRGVSYYEADDSEDEDSNSTESWIYFPVYLCGCTDNWWLDLDTLLQDKRDIYDRWKFCNAPTIYPGYVDWHHKVYFRFLKRHLKYSEENPSCNCYWPQIEPYAKEISDLAYTGLLNELETSNLDDIRDFFDIHLSERSRHGFVVGLLTHAFFYSDYHTILSDFDQYCFKELYEDYPNLHQKLISLEENLQVFFLNIYNQCLQKHSHPKIYYERGMVLFHQGANIDSLEDIRQFIVYAEKNKNQDLLTSDLYLTEGRLFSESLLYDDAIMTLTKAISKDPENKEAYFERAIAYFETGDFQKALSDYLISGFHPKAIDLKVIGKLNSLQFGQAMAFGILKGGKDSTIEFVPSLLSSLRGLGHGLWAFISNPLTVSQDMVNSANACMEFIRETTTMELINTLVPEIQECLKKWDSLNDTSKGETIGYVIGKYGVDIFICSGSIKAIQLYRNLRKANALMTLETASISPKYAQEVLELSAKKWKIREEILKKGNLKIQWDKQGKHIQDHKNYLIHEHRSILIHRDPQQLINKYAGKGIRLSSHTPGMPGYKEIVNFDEYIGYHVNQETGEKILTSWGKIHYAKDGVHIVPTLPRNR